MQFWMLNLRQMVVSYPYQKIGIPNAYLVFWWFFEKFTILLGLLRLDLLYRQVISKLTGARKLTPQERRLAATIFRDSIPYDRVYIREGTHWGTRKGKVVYASFTVINAFHLLDRQTLIHELVHIWQYYRHGVAYIPRALAAQQTEKGYDYGGVSFLRELISGTSNLEQLNYEQQASLIEDFYSHLYLNRKLLKELGSGELWELDKRIHRFLLNITTKDNEDI